MIGARMQFRDSVYGIGTVCHDGSDTIDVLPNESASDEELPESGLNPGSVVSGIHVRLGPTISLTQSIVPPGYSARHDVQFYQDDDHLHQAVADYAESGVKAGEAVVIIATPSHIVGVENLLRERKVDLHRAGQDGTYTVLDAEKLLPTVMSGDLPDKEKLTALVEPLLDRASQQDRDVRIFGELVSLLALESNYNAAIELESFWNELQKRRSFALFCAYSMDSLIADVNGEFLTSIVLQHSHVVPAEGYSTLKSEEERSREVIALQQKAILLEAEVTARRALDARLQDALLAEQSARAEAEAALASRDEFLAIAAHDLRTPLTVLSGHAQLMLRQFEREQGVDTTRISTVLNMLVQQSARLSDLVDQLFDISRLREGSLTIQPEPTDISKLVQAIVHRAQAQSPEQAFSFRSRGATVIRADPVRVEQIVNNLIDNAIKHSPGPGAVDLTVTPGPGGGVCITVRDYGPGVAEQDRIRMFERFYRANRAHGASGLGLGLYISRQIAEAHGGSIKADFPSSGGSLFSVFLPSGRLPASFNQAAAD